MLRASPAPTDRERWLELFHDPDQLRFGTPGVRRRSRRPSTSSTSASPPPVAALRRRRAERLRGRARGRARAASWARPAGASTSRRAPGRRRRLLGAPGLPRPGRRQPGAAHAHPLADHRRRRATVARVQLDHSVENRRPAASRWPPASSARAYDAATSRCATRPPRRRRAATTSACTASSRLSPVPAVSHDRSPALTPRDTTPTRRGDTVQTCGSHWSPRSSCPATSRPPTSPVRSSSRLVDGGHDVVVFAGGSWPGHLPRRPDVLGQPDDVRSRRSARR